jgi:tetratricopeptide (TPR) repeat protein
MSKPCASKRSHALPRLIVGLVFLYAASLAGCGNSFDTAYAAATKGRTGQALYDELLRLDQSYPMRLKLKIDLGASLLSVGDLKGAKTYLDQGERLIGPFVDARFKYALYAEQAELKFREGEFDGALANAAMAIACPSGDELGIVLLKAKAESALKDQAAALEDFDAGWAAHRGSMGAEDYRAYAVALHEAGRVADALQVLGDYQKAYPYDPGLGLVESGCYEKLGDMSSAILSAFKEYEFRRGIAGISGQALLEALDAGLGNAGAGTAGSKKSLERLVTSLKAFVRGDWSRVEDVPERGFGEYVRLAAKLEAGTVSAAELERYILLEPSLRSFQSYYCHLWRGNEEESRILFVEGGEAPAREVRSPGAGHGHGARGAQGARTNPWHRRGGGREASRAFGDRRDILKHPKGRAPLATRARHGPPRNSRKRLPTLLRLRPRQDIRRSVDENLPRD